MRVLGVRNWSTWLFFLLILPIITFVAIGPSINSPFSMSDLAALGVSAGRFHPADVPILKLLKPYLGLDPKPYFEISLFLRAICAASFYPLTTLLTRYRTFSILSTALFAVGNPGIESSQSFVVNMEVFIAIALANLAFYAFLRSKTAPSGRMRFLTLFLLASAVLVSPRRMSVLLIFPLLDLFWAFRTRKRMNLMIFLRQFLPTTTLCLILFYFVIASSWWFHATSGIKVTQLAIPKILASIGYTIIPFDAMYIPFSALYAQGALQRIVISYELLAVILLVGVTTIAIFRPVRSMWIAIGLGITIAMIAGRTFQWQTPLDLYALLIGGAGLITMLERSAYGVRKNSNEGDLQFFVFLWSIATLALSWLTSDAMGETVSAFYTEHRYLLVPFAGFTIVLASALAQHASSSPRYKRISLVIMLIMIAVNMVADHHFFQRVERLRATHPEYQP